MIAEWDRRVKELFVSLIEREQFQSAYRQPCPFSYADYFERRTELFRPKPLFGAHAHAEKKRPGGGRGEFEDGVNCGRGMNGVASRISLSEGYFKPLLFADLRSLRRNTTQDRVYLTDGDEFLERNAFFDGPLDRLLKALPHGLGAQFSLGF